MTEDMLLRLEAYRPALQEIGGQNAVASASSSVAELPIETVEAASKRIYDWLSGG